MEPGNAEPAPAAWSRLRLLAFRCTFAYFALYLLPFPLNLLPIELVSTRAAEWVAKHVLTPWSEGMDTAVRWLGTHVVEPRFKNLHITVGPGGSGDTTWNYVQQAAFVAAALLVGLLWMAIDRRRPHHERLRAWLRVAVRFSLAAAMIGYGGSKVIKTQFMSPTIDDMLRPLGDKSPMGLLWTFMGYSDAYCAFTGAAEMVGGLLLLTRRTTTLGALVSAAVMVNVVMLNFCFDTPVKLYSSNLLAMALWLAANDARRLFDFLVLHRATAPAPLGRLFQTPWLHWSALVFRTLLLGSLTWLTLEASFRRYRQMTDPATRSKYYGSWEVEVFEQDGAIVSADELGHPDRWQRLRIGNWSLGIERADATTRLFVPQLTMNGARLTLTPQAAPPYSTTFRCEQPEPDTLALDGELDGRNLHVELRRQDDSGYYLETRGFHWINERPDNR